MVPAAKILETAKAEKADIIGLSGLITPSLDEMCHVAAEMERQRLRPAAADRRRDHQPRAYGGEDPSELPARPDGLCHRREPRGRRRRGADVARQPRAIRRRRARRIRPHRRRACARRGEQAAAVARRRARQCAQARLVRQLPAAGADLPRHARARRSIRSPSWSTTSTGRRSSRPGSSPANIPAILDDKMVGEAARSLYDDAQAMLRKIVDERWFRASAVVGFWPANSEGDDILVFADEARSKPIATLHTLRQQLARREGRANVALADFVAPRTSGLPTISAPSWSPPASARTRSPSASSTPTTTIPRSWSRRWPTAWPKPSPSGCTSACARSSGATRPTRRCASSELIAREISRHPPGARLSGAARPHREGDAVPAARRRAHRRAADRKLRDVAGRLGLRALFQPSREPLFRRRQDRARPGRGLRPAQGLDARAKPNAGWRRSSTTIRWRWRASAAE